jgi:DNA-binding NarL/FixJ family response regulator
VIDVVASSGPSATREVVRSVPLNGMIFLAFEDCLVAEAFQAGIRGYVLKARVAEDLPLAIQEVARGRIYFGPGIPSAVVEASLAAIPDLHV